MTLGPQIHISRCAELIPMISPVKNDGIKPRFGLWTSTLTADSRSCSWWDAAHDMSLESWLAEDVNVHQLTPNQNARVLVINSLLDLKHALSLYPGPVVGTYATNQHLDFELMAESYDAIHLTEEGQWATRLSRPNLYTWDCECTLWFRWAFSAQQSITRFERIIEAA